jgi:hypothetical protein
MAPRCQLPHNFPPIFLNFMKSPSRPFILFRSERWSVPFPLTGPEITLRKVSQRRKYLDICRNLVVETWFDTLDKPVGWHRIHSP